MSQEELAARAGLSSVKMIESGKSTGSVQALLAIAAALDTTIGELLADPDEPLPQELEQFLTSPGASDVTSDEILMLKHIRARGKRPTQATYYFALQTYRSMEKTEQP